MIVLQTQRGKYQQKSADVGEKKKLRYYPLHLFLFLFAPPLGRHDTLSKQSFLLQSHYIGVLSPQYVQLWITAFSSYRDVWERHERLFPQLKHAVSWGEKLCSSQIQNKWLS